jgi:hypothetical protein
LERVIASFADRRASLLTGGGEAPHDDTTLFQHLALGSRLRLHLRSECA